MKKIADGYFYDVYDLGNGRVLKRRRSFNQIVKSIKGKTDTSSISLLVKTYKYIRECKQATHNIINKFAAINHALIGNPVFINQTDYEQDRVVLLMDYFETHSLEENKLIIDKYIELIELFLEYGVHDYVYKFKNSYGVNKDEQIVFVDFNEVTFSKKKTLDLVKSKHWYNEAQFKKFKEGELKNYIAFKFTETLTPESVGKLWGSRLGI